MKKSILIFLGVMSTVFPLFSMDFDYEYMGQTLTYSVIDEEARTVGTKAGAAVDGRI